MLTPHPPRTPCTRNDACTTHISAPPLPLSPATISPPDLPPSISGTARAAWRGVKLKFIYYANSCKLKRACTRPAASSSGNAVVLYVMCYAHFNAKQSCRTAANNPNILAEPAARFGGKVWNLVFNSARAHAVKFEMRALCMRVNRWNEEPTHTHTSSSEIESAAERRECIQHHPAGI